MAVKDAGRARVSHDEESHLLESKAADASSEGALPVPLPRKEPMESPLEGSTTPPEVMPDLTELARLQRVEKYHRRRALHIREDFHRTQVAAAKADRLCINSRHVRRTLAECVRAEDKQSFANLYNSFHDACAEQTSPSISAPTEHLEDIEVRSPSFMAALSAESQRTLLDFLSRLRFDADFLAQRLVLLGQKELSSLMPDAGSSRSSESVLAGSQRSNSRSVRPIGFAVDRLLDDLSAASFRSSLETLMFWHGSSASQGSSLLPWDMWATVSARMIVDQRHGSERLIPALFDIAAYHSPWPGKDRLELWLVDILRDGQFLLDQPSRQSFRVRVQGQQDLPNEEKVRSDDFYDHAVRSLLELLADASGPSVIPPGARKLTKAIHLKFSGASGHREDLPSFLVKRWLFSTFIPELLVLPESHGLLQGYYIGDLARQRILREVAVRSQRSVFDVIYAWYYATTALDRSMLTALLGNTEATPQLRLSLASNAC